MKILHPLLSNCVTRLDITFADSNGHEKKSGVRSSSTKITIFLTNLRKNV
jgi:hypothetical protein